MTFPNERAIRIAIEESLPVNSDRGFVVEVTKDETSGNYNARIDYIARIVYDRQIDPTLMRDPEITTLTEHLIIPRDITARELLDKIEAIELETLKYE